MVRKTAKLNHNKNHKQFEKAELTNIGHEWPDILAPFVSEYNLKLTASEIYKKTGIPRRTIARVLSKLVNINLTRYVIEGKNKKFYLDLNDQRIRLLIGLIENYKALKFSIECKKEFIAIEEIIKLKNVVLFGSYAKRTATPESDIDLLVISNDSEKIREIARKQIKKVNMHFSTIEEFEKLLKKKNTLATEIVKNHIIFGDLFIEVCWRFYKNEL